MIYPSFTAFQVFCVYSNSPAILALVMSKPCRRTPCFLLFILLFFWLAPWMSEKTRLSLYSYPFTRQFFQIDQIYSVLYLATSFLRNSIPENIPGSILVLPLSSVQVSELCYLVLQKLLKRGIPLVFLWGWKEKWNNRSICLPSLF